MDGGIVGAIVALGTVIAGGPHLWKWLVERRRVSAELSRIEHSRLEAAEARLQARLEERVTHLEGELAELRQRERALEGEKRSLERTLEEERADKARLRLAYAQLSEQVAIDRERARAREEALERRIVEQDERIQALESAIRERDRVVAAEITRAIAAELAKRDAE